MTTLTISIRLFWKVSVGVDEHAVIVSRDVEKVFRYKIHQLDLFTKLCRWLSGFLVGRVIQLIAECFLSSKLYLVLYNPGRRQSAPKHSLLDNSRTQRATDKKFSDNEFKRVMHNLPKCGLKQVSHMVQYPVHYFFLGMSMTGCI